MQWETRAGWQTDRQTGGQAVQRTDKQVDTDAGDRPTSRRTYRLCRQTVIQTDSQVGHREGRQAPGRISPGALPLNEDYEAAAEGIMRWPRQMAERPRRCLRREGDGACQTLCGAVEMFREMHRKYMMFVQKYWLQFRPRQREGEQRDSSRVCSSLFHVFNTILSCRLISVSELMQTIFLSP